MQIIHVYILFNHFIEAWLRNAVIKSTKCLSKIFNKSSFSRQVYASRLLWLFFKFEKKTKT